MPRLITVFKVLQSAEGNRFFVETRMYVICLVKFKTKPTENLHHSGADKNQMKIGKYISFSPLPN